MNAKDDLVNNCAALDLYAVAHMTPDVLRATLLEYRNDATRIKDLTEKFDSQRPYFCEGSDAMVALEEMVDRVGLSNVLWALEHVCHAKAEHLASNWQDAAAAKIWTRDAAKCSKLAAIVEN
jgi:hypothetical protein